MRFYLFFFLLLTACSSQEIPTLTVSEKIFFDLPSFFQKEIAQLEKSKLVLEKTSTINGKIEIQQLEEFDLTQELSIFSNADINKSTWKDQYQVDSIKTLSQQLQAIQYTALNDNLKTKLLKIVFEKGMVAEINIQKRIDNMAVQSDQSLTYYPRKGYRILNEQSMVLTKPQRVGIEVAFIRK